MAGIVVFSARVWVRGVIRVDGAQAAETAADRTGRGGGAGEELREQVLV